MSQTELDPFIVGRDDLILVTGATGFIGSRLVENLLERGFRNLRCFTKASSDVARVEALSARHRNGTRVEVIKGNLLSHEDCAAAAKDVAIIFHLAAARGEKSFPDAFLNSVVTTRNLLEACLRHRSVRRFVNVSSFAVYSNTQKPSWRLLDESCPVEKRPELRGDAYCFAKVKQDEIVTDYGKRFGIPYVIVRRVDGDVFNVVDEDLPSSRKFLRLYKQNVRHFKSIYVPHFLGYALCYAWERYSAWSHGQLEPVFNRSAWHAYWKKTRYSNEKLKTRLGWTPKVPTSEGFRRYFQCCRESRRHA